MSLTHDPAMGRILHTYFEWSTEREIIHFMSEGLKKIYPPWN